ncbi:hypothetical protein FH972_025129 [Carpinus fangiana]|uniref:Uncharacterized protein n=1 Tax=Carpinus fangiana TaxID=176857 RepID=A0A5N6L0A1_9ROSI|nr:hypothetical protein FH972_025129 [Carpinus fangiana]
MPSKFPWGKSKSSKKPEHEPADDVDAPSPSRQTSVATTLEYPGSNPDHYYRGGSNYEQQELDEYAQQSSYQHVPPDRTGASSSFSLPDSESEVDSGHRAPYQFPPASPTPESSARRGIRDRLGLSSSSRENVSDDDETKKPHPHRDQFRSKLGFGRRASVRHKASPSSSQPDLLNQEPRLPSIAQSDEHQNLGVDPAQRSYEPSPVIPQYEQGRHAQYQAYRAPANDAAGWTEDGGYSQQPQNASQALQQYPPRRSSQQYHQGVPVYEQEDEFEDQQPQQPQPSQQHQQQQQQQPPQYQEPVYKAQEYKTAAEGIRRQESVRRQSSVLRKTVQGNSLRGHRKSQSSEANIVVAPPTPVAPASLQIPRNPEKSTGGMSPNPPGISRSNTTMQQGQDSTAGAATREASEKYSKVKRYYFEKDDQVKQLQNTLAHQRLSQSRTSLDDGEYIQRFTRLDGLISQLAFGFRKDWKSIPPWLQPCVNKDAISIGKQEMTAVGRAFISRWLAEEVFDKYFSPALEPGLSMELKSIQKNIRAFHPPFQTSEEQEALTARIINWRLSTVDGMQHSLSSGDAATNKKQLIDKLTAELIAAVQEHMTAPPVGLEGGVHMIIELAVAILANLPFESRDVHIDYILPGTLLGGELMKIETGIPPLAVPMVGDAPASDSVSIRSATESTSDMQVDETEPAEKGEKKGFLGGLMGERKKAGNGVAGFKHGSAANSQTSLAPPGSSSGAKEADANPRVRMAVFLGLEIRGKMVLAKAPVYRTPVPRKLCCSELIERQAHANVGVLDHALELLKVNLAVAVAVSLHDGLVDNLLQLHILEVAADHHLEHKEQLAVANEPVAVNVVHFEREAQLLVLVALGREGAQPADELAEVNAAAAVLVEDGDHALRQRVRGYLRQREELVALDRAAVVFVELHEALAQAVDFLAVD